MANRHTLTKFEKEIADRRMKEQKEYFNKMSLQSFVILERMRLTGKTKEEIEKEMRIGYHDDSDGFPF